MSIDLVLTMHQRDGNPGDRVKTDDPEVARSRVHAGVAVYATKAAAKEAGEPDGPTARAAAAD